MLNYKRILESMKKKGMTKYGLAKLTGISEVLIGRYLSGKTDPSTDNVSKISVALSIDIRELI